MNIVVCSSQVPFVRGGAENLVDGLIAALRLAGHGVETVVLPWKWYPRSQLEQQALAWRTLDLDTLAGRAVDLVICTKYPTWAVRHPNKVVWLVHQHRQVYDWYGTPRSDFGNDLADVRARRTVLQTDLQGLGEARRVYTISRNVADRLARYTGLTGSPLYPPTEQEGFYNCGYGDYIFTVSRLDNAKRIELLLSGLKKARSGVRAVIAGSGPEEAALKSRADRLGLANRVEFVGRVSDQAKLDWYAGSLAVFFAPVDEDYGYITIEAMRSAKAVITAPDSGGVLEFVREGYNGYICASPADFGAAFDRLYRDNDRGLAKQLGEAGLQTVRIIPGWPQIVETLTGRTRLDH